MCCAEVWWCGVRCVCVCVDGGGGAPAEASLNCLLPQINRPPSSQPSHPSLLLWLSACCLVLLVLLLVLLVLVLCATAAAAAMWLCDGRAYVFVRTSVRIVCDVKVCLSVCLSACQ